MPDGFALSVPRSQQWNLVEFLPRALHQPMQLLLAEWMYLPWQEANRAAAAARGATQGGSQAVLDTRQAEQIQVSSLGALWHFSCSKFAAQLPVCPEPVPKLHHLQCRNCDMMQTTTESRLTEDNCLPPFVIQVEFLRGLVSGRWGDKVMTRVSSIIRHVPPGSTHPDCVFPQRAGSHLTQVRHTPAHTPAPTPPSLARE